MPLVTLPNGLVVETASEKEATFLYGEIFERNAYLRHGVEVAEGDCVVDVGANVGFFAASLVQQHPRLRLVLFEPVPETFGMLSRNAERLLADARVTLVQAGVGATAGKAVFELDPKWSIGAGVTTTLRELEASGHIARRTAGRLAWNLAAVADAERLGLIDATARRRIEKALNNRLLGPFAYAAIWALFAARRLKRRRTVHRVECEVTTLSHAMRAHEIDRIDLLKVDAEGAEWPALQGIEDDDWPRIRQVVLEVHNTELTRRVAGLLESKGYDVSIDHDDWRIPGLLGYALVYARR